MYQLESRPYLAMNEPSKGGGSSRPHCTTHSKAFLSTAQLACGQGTQDSQKTLFAWGAVWFEADDHLGRPCGAAFIGRALTVTAGFCFHACTFFRLDGWNEKNTYHRGGGGGAHAGGRSAVRHMTGGR